MLYVSPAKIASYVYHECERNFYFQSLAKERRGELDVPEQLFQQPAAHESVLHRGVEWEEEVILTHLAGQVKMGERRTGAPLSHCYLDGEETIKELKRPSKRYLYQPTLIAPPRFYERYGLDSEVIRFAACRPDLIECIPGQDGFVFRIIDIKSSDVLKLSHRVQTALYALILSSVLEEHGIRGNVDWREAGVWTYKTGQPQTADISQLIPYVEPLLADELPALAEKPPDELFWHLDYRCEWCPFYNYCLDKAREQSHISLVPYLSSHASRFIRERKLPETLGEFRQFLERQENRHVLKQNAGLTRQLRRLETQLAAIVEEKVIPHDRVVADMPKWEDIRLIFTAQRDPSTGKITAASLYRVGGADVFGTGSEMHHVIAGSFEECDEVGRKLTDALDRLLQTVHDYNRGREWRAQKSVQAYVVDNYEWDNVQQLLQELLFDPEYQEKAVRLLSYFHCSSLASASDHPSEMVPLPVVVLTTAVSQLFALPVHVAYRLEDLSTYIAAYSASPFLYRANERFSFRLTNAMKMDVLHDAWQTGDEEKREAVAKELSRRLWAAHSIIQGIRAWAANIQPSPLAVWPEKFRFPASAHYCDPLISKLAFMARYEALLNYLDIRHRRSLPLAERLETGVTLHITYLGDGRFRLNNRQALEAVDQKANWLLTECSEEGEKAQQTFPDMKYAGDWSAPKGANLYFTRIRAINDDGKTTELELELPKWLDRFPLVKGRNYSLSLRYADFTTARVLRALRELDQEHHRIVELIRAPLRYRKTFRRNWEVDEVKALLRQSGLTKSQRQAFLHLLHYTLTLVWGPPGTGKTHFIAAALRLLMEFYEKRGRKLSILISGFTHAAIENVLRKVQELVPQGKADIAKLGAVQTEHVKGIAELADSKVQEWLDSGRHSVLGATLYGIQRAHEKGVLGGEFDVVVLDEASQIRVADSLLALRHVKKAGRLLIVGDHFQLPPIIQGAYKSAEGDPPLFESIFRLLFDADVEKQLTCQLTDNFRMNEALCRYPADQIYGRDYTAFNRQIAEQTLALAGAPTADEWVEAAIDPDYPLVVCTYDGVYGAQENEVEARWVASITKTLRERLLDGDGKRYHDAPDGDKAFWRRGLFIISPHRAQIRAIRRALEREGLRPPFFVDTVDKMQGQEAEAAIISYGVADPELAAMEGEFIYSLNRLNVSLTRARKKTILFLSRHLLSPSLHVLDDDEYREGVNFMLGLEHYASKHGEAQTFVVDGAVLHMYRVGRRVFDQVSSRNH
ncbi:AAA family ATPase [Geobacillus sp. 46C-IIa]|uniref:bifunctional RecB family nuclease/DEAD/DEAH box helicase n=1 Tax=Geobacillus sp. 46C-IIa TaxID=1963025 RepID=UPI0009BF5DDA|nr:AAA domain-containing protein [Geobacillus sp. 46C-IIa]OQP04065.1 AAA family ATPase [Geobacillus sp. 46C-IIa]QNU26668.1 AAA family ATPase [Geobacillus sp. 46C-IIa]